MLYFCRSLIVVVAALYLLAAPVAAKAQTLEIRGGAGGLNGETIYRQVDYGLGLQAFVDPDDTTGFTWTISGTYQILDGGTLNSKAITVKWTAAGTYSVNLSYGAATAALNVIVTTEA